MAGSEGTLALITEAVLATQPLPRHRAVSLLLFDSLDGASRAVMEVLAQGPSACDLMDRRHLSLARETEARFDPLVPPETEAVLLVEMEADRPWEVRQRLHRLVDQIHRKRQLAFGSRQAFDAGEIELFWQLAHKMTPALYRMKGPARPVPVVEDVAVPPEVLPEFLVRMQNVLKRHQVTASMFCHAGQGQLHIQPFLNLELPEDVREDAAPGRRPVRGGLRRGRDDQRRTCLRPEPHAVRPPAVRPALRRVPGNQAALRPEEHSQSGQGGGRRARSFDRPPAAGGVASGRAARAGRDRTTGRRCAT